MIVELSLDELDADTLTGGMEVNILIGECHDSWIEALFDPREDEFFVRAPEEMLWAHLLAALGCFPSVSQARKNGWDQEIPGGWSEITIGKARRLWIYVLKGNQDIRTCLQEGYPGSARETGPAHGGGA
jgi:hypothetical protein